MKILTPSRFPALLEVDEKGDGVNQVEYEDIISVEEEIVIEETEDEVCKEENKKEEVEASNDIMEDTNGREAPEEGNKSGKAGKSVAGIEHWSDLTANSIRPSLPRRSKMMHKIVPDKNMQGGTPWKKGRGTKISSQ